MTKLIKILILVSVIVAAGLKFDSWGAARWEKQLKLTGYYYGDSAKDEVTTRVGINSFFIRRGVVASWVNQLIVNYDENTKLGVKTLVGWNTHVKLVERYTYNLSAFAFCQLEFAATGSVTEATQKLDGDNIFSETTLTIGKTFSRYLKAHAGFKVEKQLMPDGDPTTYLTIISLYDKSLGYRTKISIKPVIDINPNDLSNYELVTTMSLTYKFGRRISLAISAVPKYWSTGEFDSTATVDLVYDLFVY